MAETKRSSISRRALLGGALAGVTAVGLSSCSAWEESKTPETAAARRRRVTVGYANRQSIEGTRVTSGSTIAVTYGANVGVGDLLVAIITRQSDAGTVPTVGQVTDSTGNHWKQAVEFTNGHNQGIDLWFCESAGGGNSPTVTATLLAFPTTPISGMNMVILDYDGNSGYELIDQIAQASIVGSSAIVTTDFALAGNHDLAISVVTGNMEAATVPAGWNSRLADTSQSCWVADNVDTGAASAGSQFSATWSGLTGCTNGAAILACFKLAGATEGPTLLQMSYTDSYFPSPPALSWVSQAYPVDPIPGDSLLAFITGISLPASSRSTQTVTDTAGNAWRKVGESGVDDRTGVDWTAWLCHAANGGATALTATFDAPAANAAFLLLEFQGLPALSPDQTAKASDTGVWSVTTTKAVHSRDLAVAILSSIYFRANSPGPGWTQILSDTSGSGWAQMQLATIKGALTASWGGHPEGGSDILLTSFRRSP
jgi:hypothetical protein